MVMLVMDATSCDRLVKTVINHTRFILDLIGDRAARPVAQPHSVRLPQSSALRKPVLPEQALAHRGDRPLRSC
ncbi:MAG: hypothetical protein KME49_16580 [Brasilonema octagenarum HA4186-MV1]|nr:hypothetical protein [Brasilonema octagenarum HA4186-MV1]